MFYLTFSLRLLFKYMSASCICSRFQQQAHSGVQRGDRIHRPHLRHHGRWAHYVPSWPGVRLPEGEGKRFLASPPFVRSFSAGSRALIKQQEEPHVCGKALCVPLDIFESGDCYFRTQRGGHGAQHTRHVNGFSIVRKQQINSLCASSLASFMTIKIVEPLCSVRTAAEWKREKKRAVKIFIRLWLILIH